MGVSEYDEVYLCINQSNSALVWALNMHPNALAGIFLDFTSQSNIVTYGNMTYPFSCMSDTNASDFCYLFQIESLGN